MNAFNYSEDDGSDGKTMGINARIREDEGLRRKQMLGYYDTVLSEQAPIESYGKPSFQKAVLENGETLVLRLKLASKYERFMLKYNYGFEVFDDSNKKRLAFYIKGSDLGDNDNNVTTTHTVNVTVIRYNENKREEIPKEYPLQITVNENKEICIVLDAVDLQAARILDEKNRAAVAGNETYEELLDSAFIRIRQVSSVLWERIHLPSGSRLIRKLFMLYPVQVWILVTPGLRQQILFKIR